MLLINAKYSYMIHVPRTCNVTRVTSVKKDITSDCNNSTLIESTYYLYLSCAMHYNKKMIDNFFIQKTVDYFLLKLGIPNFR